MTIGQKNFSVFMETDSIDINFPDSDSPYVPEWIEVHKDFIIIGVHDKNFQILEKKIEWRDALIMHKALTRIFGKKPKKKRKA